MSRRADVAIPVRPPPFIFQRRALLLAWVLIAGGFVVGLAGSSIDVVLYRLLTDGVLAAAWLLAAGGIGAALMRLNLRPRPADADETSRGALSVVTAVAIGLGIFSLVMLGLGLIGFLNGFVCLELLAIGWVLAVVKIIRAGRVSSRISEWLSRPAGWSWLWLLTAPVLGISIVAAMVPPGVLWGNEPNGYDVLEYHLEIPREWYEAGRMTALDHNAFSYFPQGVEMQYLLAMELRGGPWKGMYLAQLMHLAMVALSVVAVYAGAQTFAARGASRAVAPTIAGVAAAVVPWMTLLAPIAYNEGGLLLYGALAIAWVAQTWARRSCYFQSLTIAGVCAGFACGVKLTAVPILIVAVPIALLCVIDCIQSLRRIILGSIIFVIIALVVFGPWMARNIAWTGNPFFPEGQELFGHGPFTPVQSQRWKQAHSATAAQHSLAAHLAAAKEQIVTDWRYGFVLLPLGVLAGIVGLRKPAARFLLALLILQFIFWVVFTHLQGRFFVLAIPIGALLIGQIEQRRWLVPAGAIVVIQFAIALGLVLDRFAPMAGQFRAARAFGIDDLSFMIPADAQALIRDLTPLDLVGDARAFAYREPRSWLRYRTVFDVKGRPGEPIVEAWLGSPARPYEAIVMDPPEIQRLSRTYFDVPNLSPNDPAYGRMPFVVPPRSATSRPATSSPGR